MRKPNGYWTLERCKEDAKKYKHRSDWRKNSSSSSSIAQRNGWLEECCAHMDWLSHRGYWTYEKCYESASKYKTRSDWKRGDINAYAAAQDHNWLDACTRNMERINHQSGYWTIERCKEDAARFETRVGWIKGGKGYVIAYKKGWLDECCSHMELQKKQNGYWTLDRCKSSAAKYNSRSEWASDGRAGYMSASKNGWVDICCEHMNIIQYKKGYWNKDRCLESALKYSTRTEWKYSHSKAYDWARSAGILDICCEHMEYSQASASASDMYIRALMVRGTNIKRDEIPPELIELKREQIKLHRLIKEVTQ